MHITRPALLAVTIGIVLAPQCPGQGDFDLDKVSPPGTLGTSLPLSIANAPPGLLVLIPSFSAGPTPISIVDPSDPRSL